MYPLFFLGLLSILVAATPNREGCTEVRRVGTILMPFYDTRTMNNFRLKYRPAEITTEIEDEDFVIYACPGPKVKHEPTLLDFVKVFSGGILIMFIFYMILRCHLYFGVNY